MRVWLAIALVLASGTVRAEPDTPAPGPKKAVGLALVGAGALAVGAGVYFGLHAKSESDQVQSGHGVFDPSLEAAGKRDETRAESLWTLGGAAIVVGGVIFAAGMIADDPPKVGVVPRGDGAIVVWRCAL